MIKKPKLLRKPKKPKKKTISAMKRYLERLEYVEKENRRRLAEYEKLKKQYEALKNKIARV